MSRIEEIDKIVDEIGNADSLYEFAECVYEDRQRIAELEEKLKNAIVLPKYKRGQPVYYICGNKIIEAYFQKFNVNIDADVIENPHEVTDDDGFTDIDYDFGLVDYRLIYSTNEEAQAKLKELKGEKK